jgi:hypothetical protein
MQSRCVRSGRIHFTTSVCTTLRSLGIGLCQIIKLEAAVAEPCHNLEQESAKAVSHIVCHTFGILSRYKSAIFLPKLSITKRALLLEVGWHSTVAVNPIISSTCLMHARYLDSSARFSVSALVQRFEKLSAQDSGAARTQRFKKLQARLTNSANQPYLP